MIRRTSLFALACLTISSLALAAGRDHGSSWGEETRDWSGSYALASGGSVSLDNVNGSVTITGWDGDEVSIEATIRAEDMEHLDRIRIEVRELGGDLAIETKLPQGHYRGGAVDYTIQVPRGARLDGIDLVNGDLEVSGVGGSLEANLVNGEIRARDLAGDVELETVNGTLNVALDSLSSGQRVSLSSVNGSVDLRLPANVDADVEAETVHGPIRNDFGLYVDESDFVGRSLRGTIGGGGARVEIENVNGPIDISMGS